MGDNENFDASVIVNTNLLQEKLNMEKARASCTSINDISPELIICATYDIPSSGYIPLSK